MATEPYREKAIEEYGEECSICNSTRNVEVHHIDGDHSNADIDNLLVVCGPCHGDIHSPNRKGMPHDKFTNHLPQESVFGSSDGELIRRSVTITEDQRDWLENNVQNFSSFVRNAVDEERY